jgi:hypothetical protein
VGKNATLPDTTLEVWHKLPLHVEGEVLGDAAAVVGVGRVVDFCVVVGFVVDGGGTLSLDTRLFTNSILFGVEPATPLMVLEVAALMIAERT